MQCCLCILSIPRNGKHISQCPWNYLKNTIDQYIEMGGKSVGFTPIVGDPMLDKFFFERLEYLENKNEITDVGFYTNGIALVPKKIDKLLVERNFNLNINMSFGGYDSDSYFKVMGVDMFKVVKKI